MAAQEEEMGEPTWRAASFPLAVWKRMGPQFSQQIIPLHIGGSENGDRGKREREKKKSMAVLDGGKGVTCHLVILALSQNSAQDGGIIFTLVLEVKGRKLGIWVDLYSHLTRLLRPLSCHVVSVKTCLTLIPK